MAIIDLTGNTFGKLTVIKMSHVDSARNANWLCLCSCGNSCVTRGSSLRKGHTTSCGCARKTKTHGLFHHPLYSVWDNINNRCSNSSNTSFSNYGGRGIVVCERWSRDNADGLKNFIDDMYPSYELGLTIDRVDVNKGYYKENCRWTTGGVQSHNQRKKKNCSSSYYGVSYHKIAKKWRASISKDGVSYKIGMFFNEYDAAVAYDDKSEELYGDRPNGTQAGVAMPKIGAGLANGD